MAVAHAPSINRLAKRGFCDRKAPAACKTFTSHRPASCSVYDRSTHWHPRAEQPWRCQSSAEGDSERDVQPVLLGAQPGAEQLGRERQWLAQQVSSWLDEEWMPLDVHADLGTAAGQAYVRQREQGETDIGSILLGVASELLSFDYGETFTGAFEVANKVAELLMVNEGCDVCCRSDEDKERIERLGLVPDR